MSDLVLHLKPGREKSVIQRHPWIFSGAVERVSGEASAGATVRVVTSGGDTLGWAAFSPRSQIRARMWTWDAGEAVDVEFFRRKLEKAVEQRKFWTPENLTNAARLVHAESDGLPGLVVDRYNDWLVFQFLSAGAEAWREAIVSLCAELTGIRNLYERSDVDVRRLEDMAERSGPLTGRHPPAQVEIFENELRFLVGLERGQKTGFYLDQRDNRALVGSLCAGREVLNCFSYTGGFSLYALKGHASSVLSVDSSRDALEVAEQHVELNGFSGRPADGLVGDVFQVLRGLRAEGRTFDLIILDPPKFAQTAAQAGRAARGYKDINMNAFRLLRPGGILATFSCSGGVSAELFQKIVAGAALDAGVQAQIVHTLTQAPDHPVALNFPEGAYLKGLVCQV